MRPYGEVLTNSENLEFKKQLPNINARKIKGNTLNQLSYFKLKYARQNLSSHFCSLYYNSTLSTWIQQRF